MNIVPLASKHVSALAALMAASPLLRRYGITDRGARSSLRAALRRRDLVLIATDDAVALGLAWVVVSSALDNAAYLRLLLVAEGRRSRGVGAALLKEAERRARAAGSRHMLLLVTTTNRRARAFYAREGYRRVGVLREYARPRIDEALYVKDFGRRRARDK